MYAHGHGLKQDLVKAAKWYREAANQGDTEAQYNLGLMYAHGDGLKQDYAEAEKWYRKAAEQGDADAQHNLGLIYQNGEGVMQDYTEAAKWYRKAAEQGDALQRSSELPHLCSKKLTHPLHDSNFCSNN